MHKKSPLVRVIVCLLLSVMLLSVFAITADAKITPYYNVSASYKSSQYYKNLTSLTLTGDERYDVLNIAFSQLGYHEGDSKDQMDGSNIYGTTQYNEFSSEFGYGNVSWCSLFVSWCMRQARVSTSVAPTFASCTKYVAWLKENKKYQTAKSGYIPKQGDLIFFRDEWEKDPYSTHIGFVVGVEKNYVYTIEGNGNKTVIQRRYDIDDPYVIGYGVPAYKEKSATVYDFPLTYTPSAKGEYIIPSTGLTLYVAPDKKDEIAVNLTFSSCITSGATESSAVTSGAVESTAIVYNNAVVSAGILSGGIHVITGFTTYGYGRIYFNEDGTVADAVVDTEVTTHVDYKETVTSTYAWFKLSEAHFVDTEEPEVTVSFDLNGGTIKGNLPETITVNKGDTVVIPTITETPTKKNAEFIGWGVTKADTVNRFSYGESYVAYDSLKLYAVWQTVKTEETTKHSETTTAPVETTTPEVITTEAITSSAETTLAPETTAPETIVSTEPEITTSPETTKEPEASETTSENAETTEASDNLVGSVFSHPHTKILITLLIILISSTIAVIIYKNNKHE